MWHPTAIDEMRLNGSFDVMLILSIWGPQIRDSLIEKFDCNKEDLITYFGDTRDTLIKEDFNKWLSLNSVFGCVKTSFSDLTGYAIKMTLNLYIFKFEIRYRLIRFGELLYYYNQAGAFCSCYSRA